MKDDYKIVRETVSCFAADPACSVIMSGEGAEECLNRLFAKDVERIVPLKGMIGVFLEESGDVLAMANVFRDEDDSFLVFSDRAELEGMLMSHAGDRVEVKNLKDTHRIINVVGPKAIEVMSEVAGEDVISIPYMGFEEAVSGDYLVFRQGFAGEFEFRLMVPNDGFDALYAYILKVSEAHEGGEIDPGIMDLIWLEMRFIKEADVIGKASALEASLHWMIDFQKEEFVGRDAVMAEKANIKRRSLIVRLSDRGIAQAGGDLTIETKPVGTLARVAYSPTLDCDIAFAYLDRDTGWVGVNYAVNSNAGHTYASAVSAPLFLSRSVLND